MASETPLSDVRFLTVAEVATIMRVSKMTVYRLVHSGELEAIRVGRSFSAVLSSKDWPGSRVTATQMWSPTLSPTLFWEQRCSVTSVVIFPTRTRGGPE